MEAKLEEDLDIDSLGIVEVVMAFEDEFEIEMATAKETCLLVCLGRKG